MPFTPSTTTIKDKLEDERAIHNGFGWREFDLFASLKVPKPVIARLMNVGSKNTIYDWLEKRQRLIEASKHENTGGQG